MAAKAPKANPIAAPTPARFLGNRILAGSIRLNLLAAVRLARQ
jgi:hypothetical protein